MNFKFYSVIFLFFSILLSIDFAIIDSYDTNQQYDMEFNAIQNLSDDSNAELMWRISRAYFNQAEQESNSDKKMNCFILVMIIQNKHYI